MAFVPVMPFRNTQITLAFAQVRRLRCARCRTVFMAVTGGKLMGMAEGLLIPESSATVGEDALRDCLDTARRTAANPEGTVAACPRCHKYQPWMLRQTVTSGTILGGVAGAVLGVIALATYSMYRSGWTEVDANVFNHSFLTVVVPTVLVGVIIGISLLLYRLGCAAGKRGQTVKTDEEWSRWLQTCANTGDDPIIAWYKQTAEKPEGSLAVVSFGIKDQVGKAEGVSPLPPELLTEKVLTKNLAQFVRDLKSPVGVAQVSSSVRIH